METKNSNSNSKDYRSFNGMVVKIQERTDDNKVKTLIASFNQNENGFELGHPYDVDDKNMYCGRSFSPFVEEIVSISPITKEEFRLWKKEYTDFHLDTISYKGYDSCEEKLDLLTPYYE